MNVCVPKIEIFEEFLRLKKKINLFFEKRLKNLRWLICRE